MKTVSVILTTYNSANCIEKSVDSILHQEGVGKSFLIELIVVDDCSTDTTVEILRQKNVRYFSTGKNSGGPNKGRNIGLQNATGDFICIADHDDIWKPNKLLATLPYLEQVPIVTSGYTLIDSSKEKTIDRLANAATPFVLYPQNVTFLQKLTKSLTGQNTYLGSIIYRSELKNVLFEEHFGVVDYDWLLRLFHQNASIEVCQSLYLRFVDGKNLSLNEGYRRKDFYYSLMHIENYEALYPKETAISFQKIHGSRARFYYMVGNMKKARTYFLRSSWDLKTLMYYLTTFAGSEYVKKRFNVFG
ncbi:MAG: glycosyltransferase family 2 protein [Bacteroidia bacterium]